MSEKKDNFVKEVKESLRAKTVDYLVAALGLIAGLAWNDAIKTLIDYFFPLSKDTLFAKFIYALFITFVVVILGNHLLNLNKKNNN